MVDIQNNSYSMLQHFSHSSIKTYGVLLFVVSGDDKHPKQL